MYSVNQWLVIGKYSSLNELFIYCSSLLSIFVLWLLFFFLIFVLIPWVFSHSMKESYLCFHILYLKAHIFSVAARIASFVFSEDPVIFLTLLYNCFVIIPLTQSLRSILSESSVWLY